ncbi:MAG: serine hydrolase [Thermoanaerobaculia bacterium]
MKPRSWRTLLPLVIALAIAIPLHAADKKVEIDSLLAKYQEYGRFNGSALVATDKGVILAKGYGKANFEWDVPNAPDTKFRLGSITKQFTSMLVMQLVQEGKIDIDKPMTAYLPDYRKETGDKVTVRHLLNHTSGIPSYTGMPGFMRDKTRDPYSVDDFVKKYASGDLEFEPGSKYAYNNSGYFLLGAILEKVTGKTYEQLLTERIFKPLGMKNSGFEHWSEILPKRASGYHKGPSGLQVSPYLDMSIPYAAGSLYSTVEDLYTWDRALYTDKLLDPKLKEQLWKPGLSDYGFGWVIRNQKLTDEKSVGIVTHGGGIFGFNTLHVRVPADKTLIVLLDNTSQGASLDRISRGILNILNDLPYDQAKRSLLDEARATMEKKGAKAAVDLVRNAPKSEYDVSESEVNGLGYMLLQSGKVDEAIEIFKLNVESFPKSWNVYDSLAEAYAAKGEKALAIENYKKSVEINKANVNGVNAIKRLEGPVAKVDPAAFDKLVGVYELMPNFVLAITTEGGMLYGQATGQPRFSMTPVSATEFRIDVVNATITFKVDANGVASELVLDQGGRQMPAKKK